MKYNGNEITPKQVPYTCEIKVPPKAFYPAKSQKMGKEGFVLFKLDIKPNGKLKNYEVIAQEPGDHFLKPAVKTIISIRYEKTKYGCAEVYYDLKFYLEGSYVCKDLAEKLAKFRENT